jgi:hypothetical protein
MPTLWQARQAGWTIALRCHRRREGLKSVKPCAGELKVHFGTLIAVLGPDVDTAELQKVMRCPSCGTDRIELHMMQPPSPVAGAKDVQRPRRRMRRGTSEELTLGTSREPWFVFECVKCGRRGEYRRTKLIEEFGNTVQLPTLLAIFAHARGCGLAKPNPSQLDLTRPPDCLIRYDIE